MSSAHFYRQRRNEAIEREIQSTLPPTRVIPAGKITSLVNRLSQAPKRLPSLHPPRPSDETIHLGPESDRSMPTYDAVRDEHLALFWARQQVLLAEHQKRSTSPNSTLTPRSSRPIATGEALLTPIYRKPKPPPGGIAFPYGRPPNSARGAQRKKSPSPQQAAAQKRRNSADDMARLTSAAESENETESHHVHRVPAPPLKKAAQESRPTSDESDASPKEDHGSNVDASVVESATVQKTDSLQSSPQKEKSGRNSRSSHRSSRRTPSASRSRSRSRSNSSSRRSKTSRSSSRRSASHHEDITPSNRRNTTLPVAEGKSPGGSDLPQTRDDKGSPWHRTASIPSMELRPDPRALSPGAHLPEATPTLTPAPDNYGDDFEEDA